ncbi:DNA replication ATPase [Paramyrothecium foliicola]|nr:DNA replication ATPase [Paramyrothecium foliicola]
MSSESAEVAEDYRLALEDLSSNMRFEISNLTVIARENTEHALAIAEVLQQHILKAPPNKKLPALYVLDSIVKNVGTPYTLYFGRNLFKTFMESYAVVDNNIRKKMEEMLRTWKDPVPGSLDTRPVFSHELVRPIENALMKARAASMPPQQGQLAGRPRSAMMPHRDTPTPPGMRHTGTPTGYPAQHYPQHGAMPGQVPYPGQPHGAYYPPQTSSQPTGSNPALHQLPGSGPHGSGVVGPPAPAGVSVETLSNDIQNLIVAMRVEFSHNPHDASIQNRLKALLDLQGVLQHTSLPPDQLELIKNKVTELAAVTMRANPAQTSTPVPAPVPPQVHPVSAPSASVTPSAAPAGPFAAPQVTLDSLFGAGALAALMARQSATPQSSTPNPPYASAAIRSPPPVHVEAVKPPAPAPAPAAPAPNPLGLLDQLRKAGLIPAAASPANGASPIPPPAAFPANLASILSQAKAMSQRPTPDIATKSLFDPSALKQQFNPATISVLYDDLGIPCTQCGRRFKTDEEGRKKKTAHMDWHFRVHQRSTEAEKRGTHRSWYVDSQDWLKSREVIDADHVAATEESGAQDPKGSGGFQPKYIPVPDASSGINNVCPICQDRFENQWLDAAQEWVWLDAVLVGNRAYHASCHAEATRDREGTPGLSRRTPEPILGKRKAEVSIASPKVRSLKTSA